MAAPRQFPQIRFAVPAGGTQLLLVRHGESEAVIEGRDHPLVDGHGDPALSPQGREQAVMVGERLAAEADTGAPIDAIYVTTLRRTVQTAAPLAARLGLEPEVEADLREVHLGEWEGGSFRQMVIERHPLAVQMASEQRWEVVPGAERDADFAARVRAGVERIVAAHPDQRVVVVAHGGTIGSVLAQATGSTPFAFATADNGSISELVVAGDRWILRRYNDTSHLRPAPVSPDSPDPGTRSTTIVTPELVEDGSGNDLTDSDVGPAVARLVEALGAIAQAGDYGEIEVLRPWSRHNPRITGEFADVSAIRWYLQRELAALLRQGASVRCAPRGRRSPSTTRRCFRRARRGRAGTSRRRSSSCSRPSGWRCRSTGWRTTPARRPSRSSATCCSRTTPCTSRRSASGSPTPTGPDRAGGRCRRGTTAPTRPTTASASSTSASARRTPRPSPTTSRVLRPDADADDRALRRAAEPPGHRRLRAGHRVPAGRPRPRRRAADRRARSSRTTTSTATCSTRSSSRDRPFRLGTVYTTDNRNWEFNQRPALAAIEAVAGVAVDMESATIAANGFRYRMPNATLLCVSRQAAARPAEAQRARPRRSTTRRAASTSTSRSRSSTGCAASTRPGVPAADIRSTDEPLFGTPTDPDRRGEPDDPER